MFRNRLCYRLHLENQLVRSHSISILYDCILPESYTIDNGMKEEHEAGYLKWFAYVPNELLECHKRLYGDFLREWFDRNKAKLRSNNEAIMKTQNDLEEK